MTRAQVTLTPVIPARAGLVFDLFGEDKLTGGVGGWESLGRPRRRASLGWVGTPAQMLSLPLLITGAPAGGSLRSARSIEPVLERLESWGLPTAATGVPVVLRVTGPTLAPPGSRWVIDAIEYGERIRDASGRRVQQILDLSLMRHTVGAIVTSPARGSRDRNGK